MMLDHVVERMDEQLKCVWWLGWINICLLALSAAQTERPEFSEALDLTNGRTLVSGSVWEVGEIGAHDGEDVVVGQIERSSSNGLTVIPDHGGTVSFWSRLSGSMRVYGSNLQQLWWIDETRAWERHEMFVSPGKRKLFWRLSGNDAQAWIDEVEVTPTIPVDDALDTNLQVELDGDWAGYSTARSSDGEDHLRLFDRGRLDATLIGPGLLQFKAQGQTGSARIYVQLNDTRLGGLFGNSGSWEPVSLQIPPGRHDVAIRNSGDWAGIDALQWTPGAQDPAVETVAPNSEFGSVMGTLQPTVEEVPSLHPSLGKRIRFGPAGLALPDEEVAVGEMTVPVNGPGRLSFWWKMQQGAPDACNLTVTLNAKPQATLAYFSGDWQKYSMTLTPGEHLLKLRYTDLAKTAGSMAWLAGLNIIASPVVALGEAVDAPELPWWTGGVQDWAGYASLEAASGQDLAGSGYTVGRRQSWIATTVTGPGVLRCRWRCSGVSGLETLTFEDNGRNRIMLDADASQEWRLLEAEIPGGEHVLRWVFQGNSVGGDHPTIPRAGWIDGVEFTPGSLPISEALASNLAFSHLGDWAVVPDGRGGMAVQAQDSGATLHILADGPGDLVGELYANENTLSIHEDSTLLGSLGPEAEWRAFSQSVGIYGSGAHRLERDLLDNDGVIRLGSLRFDQEQQWLALEQAAEIPESIRIVEAIEESWEVSSALAREGDSSVVGYDRPIRLKIRGPGILRFYAKALMEAGPHSTMPSLGWTNSLESWSPTMEFDPALDTWQTVYLPAWKPLNLPIYGGAGGIAIDGFEFVSALLREHIEDHGLSFRTGGDEPWYSLTSNESPDGVGTFFRRDVAGVGWLETEVTGPATLTLQSINSADFEMGEIFTGTLGKGYSEIPIPVGSHRVRITANEGLIRDVQLLTGTSLAEALDLGAHSFVSVSKQPDFVFGESAFDGDDALSFPEKSLLSVGFLENGYAGYKIQTGHAWLTGDQEIQPPARQLTVSLSEGGLIDQLTRRSELPMSAWPVPLTTSIGNPWVVVPYTGVPDGDEMRLQPPQGQGWLEATVEGPGELWFTSRWLIGFETTLINGVEAYPAVDHTSEWVQQRYGFGPGRHSIRWVSSSRKASIDDMKWFPRNRITEALDIDLPLVTLEPIVRTSEDGGVDGDDALHLVGTMRFRPPTSGILSSWWREEGKDEWLQALRPVTADYPTTMSGEGHVVDRFEMLESPSYQEALDTELTVESSASSWTVDLGDQDFARGPLKVLAPSQGSVTYLTQSNDKWLSASRSGAAAFAVEIGATRVDQVRFSTEVDPFAEAIEWAEYGTLETFGWEVQNEVAYEGSDALKAASPQARLDVTVEGPGTLILYAKSEGHASFGGYSDSRRDVGDGWTQVAHQIESSGEHRIPIVLSLDSSDLDSPWGFWIDKLTFTPLGSMEPTDALDTTLPLTFSHPEVWQGQASVDAEDDDALRLIGPDDLDESSISVMVEGPGTFSFSAHAENDETVSVHRGTTLMLPPTEVNRYSFTRMSMPIPSGSHEMTIRFFREDRSYFPDAIDVELDHLEFILQARPPLRSVIMEPIEVVIASGPSAPQMVSEGELALRWGKLYLNCDHPGRLQFDHIGRFGIGLANASYLATVRRADWGIYEYNDPVGSIVVDPYYRFDSIVRLDPAAYPRFRSIVFEPGLPPGDLGDALDLEGAVTVVAGDWMAEAYGDPSIPTDLAYGEAPTVGGSATIETQLEGPGLLRFRLRLGPHYQTSMKLFVDGIERWEATRNGDWLEAATPLAAGMHLVRWQVATPHAKASISLDAVEVAESHEDFLTLFGLNSEAPAVRWQKLATSGEQPTMRGSQLGPIDGGLSLRLNGPTSVSYDHTGNLPETAAFQVGAGSVRQFPTVSGTVNSEHLPVAAEQGQIEWRVLRSRESQPGEGVQLSNIQIRPLEPLSGFSGFAFQSSPELVWQRQPATRSEASPGLVSYLASGNSTLTSSVEGPGTLTFDWSQSSTEPTNRFTCTINGEVIAQLDGDIERQDGLTYQVLHNLGEGTHEIQWRAELTTEAASPIVFRVGNLEFEVGARPLESTFLNIPAMRTLMGSREGWQPSTTWEHGSPAWETGGPGFAKLTFDLSTAGTLSGQMRLYREFEEIRGVVFNLTGSSSDTLGATLDNIGIGSVAMSKYDDGFSDWIQASVRVAAGQHALRWDYRNINALYNRAFLEAWHFAPSEAPDDLPIAEAIEYDGTLTIPAESEWVTLSDPELPDGDALMVGVSNVPKTDVLETMVQGPGEISFRWSADVDVGEFTFHVDDDHILSFDGRFHHPHWSTVTRTIPVGQHLMRWTFTSSRATIGRHDPAALIDQIGFKRHGHLHEVLGLDEAMLVTGISTNFQSKPDWTIEGDWAPEGDLAVVARESGAELRIDVPPPIEDVTLSVTGSGRVGSTYPWENAPAYPVWRTITVKPNADTGQVHLLARGSFFAVARLEEPISGDRALDTRLSVATGTAWAATKPPGEQSSVLQSTRSGQASTFIRGPGEVKFRWRNPESKPTRFLIDGYMVRSIYATSEWIQEVVQIPQGSHRIDWESEGPMAEVDRLQFLPYGVRETFDQWADTFGLAHTRLDDPNSDDVSNLLAYAFALNPVAYGALQTGSGEIGSLPESHVRTRIDGDWLEMSFLRRHGSGLIYVPKFSSDLSTWSSQSSKTTVIDLADGWERVTVRDPVPIRAGGRRFGHVEVSDGP